MNDDDNGARDAATADVSPRLAHMFLDEGTGRIEAIRGSLEGTGDAAVLERNAHSLASAANHFPDTGLIEVGRHVERLAEAGDIPAARALLPRLEAAWDALRGQLEAVVASAGDAPGGDPG